MKEIIQFKKQRDLGEIITDIFAFIRNEWRTLFPLLFKISGPALAVLVAAYVYYMYQTTILSESLQTSNFSFPFEILLALLVLFAAGLFYYAMLYGTLLHYIRSYTENKGTIDENAVRAGVKENLWELIGNSFLVGIITAAGAIFCFLPGIYFGVTLATTYAIIVLEKKNTTQAISYSFTLIKGEWWSTFGTFFVLFILYYLILLIFNVPQYLYFFIKGFTMDEIVSSNPDFFTDWGYLILTVIALIAQYLLYAIIALGSILVYYNLNEKRNFTGTYETIESLGKK